MGTSKEQEMLIIIPIFNHYNWFLKVVHSQISSLYLTRSWRVKLHVGKSQSSSEALQSSLGKQKPELLCITCDLTPCAHPESGHTAEVTALLCSSLGWMFAVKARNWHEAPRKLWGNGSLNKWKQYTERKAGPDKDLLDHLTKKALEPHTAWKPVQNRGTAASVLLCKMWGCLQAHDSRASSSWSTACFYGAEMTEAANTAPEKLKTILFLSLHNSLFTEVHGNRHWECTVTTKGLCDSTQLDRVTTLKHLPAASEKGTELQPKDTWQCQ